MSRVFSNTTSLMTSVCMLYVGATAASSYLSQYADKLLKGENQSMLEWDGENMEICYFSNFKIKSNLLQYIVLSEPSLIAEMRINMEYGNLLFFEFWSSVEFMTMHRLAWAFAEMRKSESLEFIALSQSRVASHVAWKAQMVRSWSIMYLYQACFSE